MARRKATFRHAPLSLAEAIRGMEVYWLCDDLRELPYNAPLEKIKAAAMSDASRMQSIADGLREAAERLEAHAENRWGQY